MPALRVIAATALCLGLATGGCTGVTHDLDDVTRFHQPQNEGANVSHHDVHLRNVFLLAGAPGQPPPATLPLYAVIINDQGQPDRLERVTVDGGGGSVQLAAPVVVPPGRPVGLDRPIAQVTGVRPTGSIPMTFTFSRAGSVRALVPVKEKIGSYSTVAPGPSAMPS
ncbi:hypothetical protein [Nonomuraea sp. NPDC004354]